MKYFLFILLAIAGMNIYAETESVFSVEWSDGLPRINGYDATTGINAYCILSEDEIAISAGSEKFIRIYNRSNSNSYAQLEVPIIPEQIFFNNEFLILSAKNEIAFVSKNGESVFSYSIGTLPIGTISSNEQGVFVHRSYDNKVVNSFRISQKQVQMQRNSLGAGYYRSEKISDNSFRISFVENDLVKESREFVVSRKLGSARIIGSAGESLFLDIQYIINDIPLQVQRIVGVVALGEGIDNSLKEIELPQLYYARTFNDLIIQGDDLYYLLNDELTATIYRLDYKQEMQNKRFFPDEFYTRAFHYNSVSQKTNLDEPESSTDKSILAPITRPQIISNAEPFDTHVWTCNASNIRDYDCGGVHVTTPSWVQVGTNVSVPYMWGGWSSLSLFDQGLLNGVSAGDCNTVGGGSGSSCAVGVDCSGFVSRVWGLTSKYGTSTLPNISTAYSSYSELLPGDIVNNAGSHVRLVHTLNLDGTFLMIEASASATNWSVGYSTYSVNDLQGVYIPRYYDQVINDPPDVTPPVSDFSLNNWETSDFIIDFTDTDENIVDKRFWMVSDFDGTEWRANGNFGFFNDNFNSQIHPDLTVLSGSWSISGGALLQSDEALTNENLYAMVSQSSANEFLYHWKMKMSGSGSARRAGIYFFCDDPSAIQRGNAYMIYYRVDDNVCQLYKSVNNSISLVASGSCTVNADTWYDCKVTFDPVSGNMQAFLNNNLVAEWVDSSPLTTGNSISFRSGGCQVYYDDVMVYKSRGASESVLVGADQQVRFQNPTPAQPSCKVFSLSMDESMNISDVAQGTVGIDWSEPSAVESVNDGFAADEDTTGLVSELSGNWSASSDLQSGISEYYFAVGTNPGSDDVYSWSTAGTNLSATSTGLSLSDQTYYFSVKAMNNAGLESMVISSDGILIDQYLSVFSGKLNDINVYPVPATEFVWVNGLGLESEYKLVSLDGKLISAGKVSTADNSIDVSSFNNGVYYLLFPDKAIVPILISK